MPAVPPTHVTGDPLLHLDALVPGFVARGRKVPVTEPVNEVLHAGELACLVGPNGAGKSTLMRTMAGLQVPLEGTVRFRELEVHQMPAPSRARHLAVVLTDAVHVPMLSAYELVAFGRVPFTGWSGRLTTADHRIIAWAIELVGATDLSTRNVAELSDGERQRIMIARALAQEPSVMILDEITGFLDLPRRIDVMRLLHQVTREARCAALLSTHDLDLALRTADRLWLLPKRGTLRVAMPETLVLDGTFQSAFELDGAEFDERSGSFRLLQRREWPVRLAGDSPALVWTERALERHGFYVAPDENGASIDVDVVSDAAGTCWRLRAAGAFDEHRALDTLILALRAHFSTSQGGSDRCA